MDAEEKKEKAKSLVGEAKVAANDGRLLDSMALFKDAYTLYPTEKIKKRMDKLQEFIDSQLSDENEEEDEMIDIGKKFHLHKSIANNLYDYQKEGVLWFWKLFKKGYGGILGDDMGLGKTIQVISFLSGMFDAEHIKTVVIVAPLAVLVNWENEFKKWAPGLRLKSFHGNNKKQREANLEKIQRSRGVLLTTYGMVVSNTDVLGGETYGNSFTWDYIILDEGHKIKNPNKTSKSIRSIPARFRYICTGTAVQNNLMEMWSLFDYTHQGELLGMRKTFEVEFAKPIVRAREKDANAYSQQVGNHISEQLRMIIAPYFLRRTKADIFKSKGSPEVIENIDASENKTEKKESSQLTPQLNCVKHDLIVWVYLNPLQLNLYQGLIKSERVKATLLTKRSPLTELNCLKKICDHPRLQTTLSKLLTSAESQEARLDCNLDLDDQVNDGEMTYEGIDEAVHAPPVEDLVKDSGKMVFLIQLMNELKKGNHRTLIFSQSRKMLDIIQKVLMSFDHKLLRLDGTISNPQDREKIIKKFQKDASYDVLLMTTQIGSVGLNLTAADRLVIFDPSWNPGTDSQAVDRIYRLGQTKDVVIYRLITCGSIEEKIYRKQIFKNAIMKQTTGSSDNPYRYFTNQQLRELFILDDPRTSVTHMQLEEMHTVVIGNEYINRHLKFLKSENSVYGVSHHDQLFSQEAKDEQLVGFEDQIDKQVALATQRVTEEVNNIEIATPKKKNTTSGSRSSTSIDHDGLNINKSMTLSDGFVEETLGDAPCEPNISLTITDEVRNNDVKETITNDLSTGDREDDIMKKLETTFATIEINDKIEDGEQGADKSNNSSTKSESILEVEEKDGRNFDGTGSSAGDLYTSCLVEPHEREDMAKLNATLGAIKIIDDTEPEKSNQNLIAKSSDEDENDYNGSVCLVTDTDTDDDNASDSDSSHGSSFSNCPETPSASDPGVIMDSFAKTPAKTSHAETPIRNAGTSLIQSLGKAYRTPPFSPVDITHAESIRRAERNRHEKGAHSTPMDSTHLSFVNTSAHVQKDIEPSVEVCGTLQVQEPRGPVSDSFNEGKEIAADPSANVTSSSVASAANESFVYVQDTGCSPMANVGPINLFDREEDEIVDQKNVSINDKSFIYVQDMGCSPLGNQSTCHTTEKKSDSFSEKIPDTVPLHDKKCKKSDSFSEDVEDTVPLIKDIMKSGGFSEDVEDTVPLSENLPKKSDSFTDVADTIPLNVDSPKPDLTELDLSVEDTIPFCSRNVHHNQMMTNALNRETEGEQGTHTKEKCLEESESSEGIDFGRLDQLLETSLSKQQSRSALAEIKMNVLVSDGNTCDTSRVWEHDDLVLSRTLGHRVRSAKKNSPNKSPIVHISPSAKNSNKREPMVAKALPIVNPSARSKIFLNATNCNLALEDELMGQSLECSTDLDLLEKQRPCLNNLDSSALKNPSQRTKQLKHLISLMKENIYSGHVEDHVLMEVTDLAQELEIDF